jgi:hypothetical protein
MFVIQKLYLGDNPSHLAGDVGRLNVGKGECGDVGATFLASTKVGISGRQPIGQLPDGLFDVIVRAYLRAS